MRKIRSFVIAIISMLLVSLIALLVVSTLTYLFKWQADKAMVGIIATYILAGLEGGFCMKHIEKKQFSNPKIGIGRKTIEALVLSNIFLLLIFVLSVFVLQNSFEISNRSLMIWGLLVSSTFLGRIL